MPHPAGDIIMNLSASGDGVVGEIILPAGLDGVFVYKEKKRQLKPGKNIIEY